jgi:nucleoside-diphosphate-sugar epimerase
MLVPDNELFRINTMGSYNIIESACKLGIKKLILASSITTYGVTYAEGDVDYASFPITEETPTTPMDSYATSKLCMERIAQSFALRYPGTDIYILRIGAVITPDMFDSFFTKYTTQPEKWKAHGWSYTEARDLGNMCQKGIEKDGLGFQVFNAVNDEITNWEDEGDVGRFLGRVAPGTKVVGEMGKWEAPVSNAKIRETLGFREEFGWRGRFERKG